MAKHTDAAAPAMTHWAERLGQQPPNAAAGVTCTKTGAPVNVTAGPPAVDTKTLTGRGTLRDLRHYVDTLRSLEAQMVELSVASKTVPALGHYLMLHRRQATGYVHLRWREVGGAKQHVGWQAMAQRVSGYPGELSQWVHAASASALALNQQHTRVREAVRHVRAVVLARDPPVYVRRSG
jgi:hypothetical protein